MNGNLVDVKFNNKRMQQFLNNNEIELQNLAMKFIAKIKYLENNN